jgi:hypothetical protein
MEKFVLKEQDMTAWNVFAGVKAGATGGLLLSQKWIFTFDKMPDVSSPS